MTKRLTACILGASILAMTACTSNEASQATPVAQVRKPSAEDLERFSKPADFAERVAQVTTGATRQEVIDILGPFDRALSQETAQCDTYGYVVDDEVIYIGFWYDYDAETVERISIDKFGGCYII